VFFEIVADACEGISDCVPACPVECIWWAREDDHRLHNAKGTLYTYIDEDVCVDCGVCVSVCPVIDAIVERGPALPRIERSLDAPELNDLVGYIVARLVPRDDEVDRVSAVLEQIDRYAHQRGVGGITGIDWSALGARPVGGSVFEAELKRVVRGARWKESRLEPDDLRPDASWPTELRATLDAAIDQV
jgi:NAD-dependent dihydropyrimidine dehydrogenase PreA subunit